MPHPRFLLAFAGLALSAPLWAGDYNKRLSVGDAAPAWADLAASDGTTSSLADLKGKELVVIAFLCNQCPVAQAYEQRLVRLNRQFGGPDGKVAVIALNVATDDEEKLQQVKEHAKARGLDFVVAVDPSQKIGRAYGASVTPQFFVLDRDRRIAYMGAFDDHLDEAKVKAHHLETAVEALLKGGKVPRAETRPNGCSIEYGGK